jgi:hypothetical protein
MATYHTHACFRWQTKPNQIEILTVINTNTIIQNAGERVKIKW